MNTTIMHDQKELFAICEMSARYHSYRRHFLKRVHGTMMFFAVLGGSAAVVKILDSEFHWLGGGIAAIIVAVELVADIQGARALYLDLYRRFTSLSGEIKSMPDADEATMRRWNQRLYDLHADEPPVFRVLNAHVRNEWAISIGSLDAVHPIGWYRRLLKNVFVFSGYVPKKR